VGGGKVSAFSKLPGAPGFVVIPENNFQPLLVHSSAKTFAKVVPTAAVVFHIAHPTVNVSLIPTTGPIFTQHPVPRLA